MSEAGPNLRPSRLLGEARREKKRTSLNRERASFRRTGKGSRKQMIAHYVGAPGSDRRVWTYHKIRSSLPHLVQRWKPICWSGKVLANHRYHNSLRLHLHITIFYLRHHFCNLLFSFVFAASPLIRHIEFFLFFGRFSACLFIYFL